MNLLKSLRPVLCLFLSLLMINAPTPSTASQMISTSQVVADLDRAQAQQEVQDYLSRTDVQEALIERGVSPEEVSSRLASLSETELRQLAGQVEQARAGGDILITILVVVLIIFLIKRI